jgi:hypothetical protein
MNLQLFGKVIDIGKELRFPPFSNDCQYLHTLNTDDILKNLGNSTDDHGNYFTARMLLLLESRCLYGNDTFDKIKRRIIKSYFKDYPDHKRSFQPMFLLNDICRFWKTLLLNYENKRKINEVSKQKKVKQKVRNFKLKYSRMTICFASIAALGSHGAPVTEKQVFEITTLTPRARLQSIAERIPDTKDHIARLLDEYSWFLDMTGVPTQALERRFSDEGKRAEMFKKANRYGDSMFELLNIIDRSSSKLRLLRNLVI